MNPPPDIHPKPLPCILAWLLLLTLLTPPSLCPAEDFTASRDGLIPWFKGKLGKSEKSSSPRSSKHSSKSPRIPKGGTLVLTDQGPLNPQQLATLQAHHPVGTPRPSQTTSPTNSPPAHTPQPAPSKLPPPSPQAVPHVDPDVERRKAELEAREKAIAEREEEILAQLEADRAELKRREDKLKRQQAESELNAHERELARREEKLTWKKAEAALVAEKLETLSSSGAPAPPVDAPDKPGIVIDRSSIPGPTPKPAREPDPIPSLPSGAPDFSPLAESPPASFDSISPDEETSLTPLAGDPTQHPPAPHLNSSSDPPTPKTPNPAQATAASPPKPVATPELPHLSSPPTPHDAPLYFIARDKTPLYIEGPTQITPADAHLDKGTAVYLISEKEIWSKVQLEPGIAGFVASDSIGSFKPSGPELHLPDRDSTKEDQPGSRTAAHNPLLHF